MKTDAFAVAGGNINTLVHYARSWLGGILITIISNVKSYICRHSINFNHIYINRGFCLQSDFFHESFLVYRKIIKLIYKAEMSELDPSHSENDFSIHGSFKSIIF